MTERPRRLAALLLAALLAAAPAAAEGEANGIFALGQLDTVATGDTLVYAHRRSGSATGPDALPPIEGRVEVTLQPAADGGSRAAHVALVEDARTRGLPPFPATGGNPVLLVFLETGMRNMATATGGSPFYIRNRIREALVGAGEATPVALDLAGGTVEARRFTVRPFADDPNRARMGAFAGLEISLVLSDEVPGGIASLEAVTGPGPDGAPALTETISFERMEEAP